MKLKANYELSSHSISVVGKHLQTSTETQKDKTNLEFVRETIKASSHSSSVIRRVKELIEMEKSNYESSKAELERLKKKIQCFIKQFDPIKEPQGGTENTNSTQVSSQLEESGEKTSLSNYDQKPNQIPKATDEKSPLPKDGKAHIHLSHIKKDPVSASELKLHQPADPKTKIAVSVISPEQAGTTQKNPDLCFLKDLCEYLQLELRCPRPNSKAIEGIRSERICESSSSKQQLSENMCSQNEDHSSPKQECYRFTSVFKETNSYAEICQEPIRVETKNVDLIKHQKQGYRSTGNVLEDLENRLKAIENERKKISEAIQEIQEARGPTADKDRFQPGLKADCLEACVLQNYNHVYQCPIFEHVEENLVPTVHTSGELFFSSNKNDCDLMSANSNLNSQEGRRYVKVAELNSQLELLKTQLSTNNQVQCHKKTEDELKQAILKNEAKVLALENSLEVKENQIKGLKRLIHLMQNEKDNIVLTNMELMFKVEEAKKETQQLNFYVTDYLNINENLLTLTQRKDEEMSSLAERVEGLQMVLSKNTEKSIILVETLKAIQEEMADLRQQHLILKQHYDVTQMKLRNTEMEITIREESMGKLTQQLTAIIVNQDFLLAETEHLRRQLQDAKYKEVQTEAELIHSKNLMNDLKGKIWHMDDEMCRLRAEMREIIKQNILLRQAAEAKDQEILNIQNETTDLWHKVQVLEDEVMEKEGQIAILKGSFSEEFWH
jgi:hypothetical protein